MENKVFTPTLLNTLIKEIFNDIEFFQNLTIEGEISGWKPTNVGHVYFNLKDNESIISGIMWKSTTQKLDPNLMKDLIDGVFVSVTGHLDVYLASGKYNFIVEKIKIKGKGNLWIEFEKLKKELEQQGLFLDENKIPIPEFCFNIGVITSQTGAVIEDIKRTIQIRFPLAKIHLFPTIVQGPNAKTSIVENIQKADLRNFDVLIVGRGGGSIEDLWPFNEKEVAFAIFNCKTPIVSAVGHETDFTISDFVADFRASTPTAAAMKVVPSYKELLNFLKTKHNEINSILENILNYKKMSYVETMEKFNHLKNEFIHQKQLLLSEMKSNLNTYLEKIFLNKKTIFETLSLRLEDLNPKAILKRGYSITMIDNKSITNIEQIKQNDKIITLLNKGRIISIVNNIVLESKDE